MRWRIGGSGLVLAIALALAIGHSPEANSGSSARLVPSAAPLGISAGRSLSLRQEVRAHGTTPARGARGTGDPLPEPDLAEARAIHTTGEAARATAVAGHTGAGPGPQILSATVGLSVDEGGASPPDVQVGVSPTAVVEMVNVAVVFWRRNGNQLTTPQARSLGSFISTAAADRRNDHVSDPRVLYDSATGRWFAVAFDVTRGETNLAISQASDPTGSWVIWTFRSTGCPDQPRLAVTNDLVVITDDLFSACGGGAFVGGEVKVVSKAALLAGSLPAGSVGAYGPDARFKAITPAQPVTPQNGAYLVSVANGAATAVLYTVTSPAATSIPIASIPIRRLTPPPPIQQAGTATPIDGGDNRVQNAVFDSGTIWFAASNACQITGQAGLWGCARLEAIYPTAGRATEEQDLALGGQKHAFFPALASDSAGNVIAVFSFASGQDYAGVGTITKLRQAGGFSNWTTVTQGIAPYADVFGGRNRWGDYFGAVRDPANPNVIWIAGEYTKATDSWGTTVAAVTAAPAAPTSPGASDTTPPSVAPKPAAGRYGQKLKLAWSVSDDSNGSSMRIFVMLGGKITSNWSEPAFRENGSYYVTWRAPAIPRGLARFCVIARDRAGNTSQLRCAGITLRR